MWKQRFLKNKYERKEYGRMGRKHRKLRVSRLKLKPMECITMIGIVISITVLMVSHQRIPYNCAYVPESLIDTFGHNYAAGR